MQAESYVGMSPGTEFEVSGKGSVKLSQCVGGRRVWRGQGQRLVQALA